MKSTQQRSRIVSSALIRVPAMKDKDEPEPEDATANNNAWKRVEE